MSLGVAGEENGATINFTPSGTASYVNNGCVAPVQPFTVEAGTTPQRALDKQSIYLELPKDKLVFLGALHLEVFQQQIIY